MTPEFRKIDLANWPRRDQYDYYTQKLNIAYNTTARVQVDHLLDFCHANGYQFYPALAYVMTRAVNQLENFRMFRDGDGALGIWDRLVPYCTFFHPDDKTVSGCWPACDVDFAAFYQDVAGDLERCSNYQDIPDCPDVPLNLYHLLCMPWLDFSSRRTVRARKGPAFFPLIAVGRCTIENGKTTLPVNLQIAHAVCDGTHAEQFFRILQEELDRFAG